MTTEKNKLLDLQDLASSYQSDFKLDKDILHQGYVLVFKKVTSQWILKIVEDNEVIKYQRLVAEANTEYLQSPMAAIEKIKEETSVKLENPSDLLFNLRNVGIRYCLKESHDGEYILCIISIGSKKISNWADEMGVDIMIDPKNAIIAGKKVGGFELARKTYIPDDDEDNIYKIHDLELKMLQLDDWKKIHIPFDKRVHEMSNIYKTHKHGNRQVVLDDRLFLRILYDILIEDKENGGANFEIDAYKSKFNHPFVALYALNDPIHKPKLGKGDLFMFSSTKNNKTVKNIRRYYGELVGFYFAFLLHYTRYLYAAAPIGFIFFIGQISLNKIDMPGAQIVIILFILWSTLMIEHWFRKENMLKFNWGVMRILQKEVPRPSFNGKYIISKTTGKITEVHENVFLYYSKVLCSLTTIAFILCGVVACVVSVWVLKADIEKKKSNGTLSVLVGMINSVQITIFNFLYTYVAFFLNDREGHRLQQEYYNNLVIKRILFYIINSFNSLFYLAYWKHWDSKTQGLNAVRIQLVTLFLTMIIIQNMLEVGFPKLGEYFKKWRSKESEKHHSHIIDSNEKNNNNNNNEIDIKINKDNIDEKDSSQEEVVSKEYIKLETTDEMWKDAFDQLLLPDSPPVLDNMAEIVVQYGYVMLFVIVFPLMPLLAIINNWIEFKLDFYNLTQSRRCVPFASNGIGVWKQVLSAFGTVAIFTNLSLATWKSECVNRIVGQSAQKKKLMWFFIASLGCLFFMYLVRHIVDDIPKHLKESIIRQEECEKYLLVHGNKKDKKDKEVKKN